MAKVKWSHSGLKDFEGCARRYHEIKVLKQYTQSETEQIRYGKELHKAAEDYVRDGVAIPQQFVYIKPLLDALLAKPGEKYPEYEMALMEDLTPCPFNSPDVWVRGIADLLIVDEKNLSAVVIDYKTGNNRYPDVGQLELMALMVFAHFPNIKQVNSGLLFVVKETMVKHRTERAEADALWWKYRERVAKLAAAFEHDVWNPTQTPLCGWCAVKTCELHPKY